MRRVVLITVGVVMMLVSPGKLALAQERPVPIVEMVVGRSGFVDEVWDYFTTVGGGLR